MSNIAKQLKSLPSSSGIYLFYNSLHELIYVGKATSLKSRVRSYFTGIVPYLGEVASPARASQRGIVSIKNWPSRPIEAMIDEVKNIKTIKTDSVLEAIILEGQYIKKYRPEYNVDWKDDKSWNYLYLTNEPFPKLKTVRQHEFGSLKIKNLDLFKNYKIKNSKFIFGPYPSLNTRETLKILHKLFYISRCEPNQKKPCFDYQLGFCLGVCTGEITAKDYRNKVIKPLIDFLQGHKKRLLYNLKKQMLLASKQQNFEEAARLRNQIKSLTHIQDVTLLNKDLFNSSYQPTNLPTYQPTRLEAYDISNLGDTGKVGSMIVFNQSGPIKSEYRKFKIKTVAGQSDVDCLKEIITRRFENNWPLPNLILVDGGIPQRNAVLKILNHKSIFLNLGVIGIAKGPTRKKNEFIFDKHNQKIAGFIQANENLLINARDEAHRFAISYQKKLRKIK
ncbi:MAG TPA: UvrB/UvrC motif-containing protein [bacterium]|nr:UvrB/UvrC motif-containing protein [bacterium]